MQLSYLWNLMGFKCYAANNGKLLQDTLINGVTLIRVAKSYYIIQEKK